MKNNKLLIVFLDMAIVFASFSYTSFGDSAPEPGAQVGESNLSKNSGKVANFFLKERIFYFIYKHKGEYFLAIDPGSGKFKVEIISQDLKLGVIKLKVVKALGLEVDLNNDGIPERDSLEGSIIELKQTKPHEIVDHDQK